MKTLRYHLALLIAVLFRTGAALYASGAGVQDIYIVVYVTENGRTGHAGIAVDNYRIVVRDMVENGTLISRDDTVRLGTLTLFDLWPKKDIGFGEYNENTDPIYFKLPRSSAEGRITPASLLEKGMPHHYKYPCDALLRIPTQPHEDFRLIAYIDSLQTLQPSYNARHYNCVDFIIFCLEKQFRQTLKAKEFVPLSWISTPNRLYRTCVRRLPAEVLRDPGDKVNRSFFRERIIKSLFKKKSDYEKV